MTGLTKLSRTPRLTLPRFSNCFELISPEQTLLFNLNKADAEKLKKLEDLGATVSPE
jgi:hypothetical protein